MVVLDGYDVAIMGFVAPQLRVDWVLSAVAIGAVLSAALIGQAVGALAGGPRIVEALGALQASRGYAMQLLRAQSRPIALVKAFTSKVVRTNHSAPIKSSSIDPA